MDVPFVKYSGCGNDFILVDNRTSTISHPLAQSFVKRLCHRQLGIGADGLILLENSSSADFRMRIFNADGSEAEMCGNGIRCLTRFIADIGLACHPLVIETLHSPIGVYLQGDQVKVSMPSPRDFKNHVSIKHQGADLILHHLDTGVPHVVIFVDDIETSPLLPLASSLRHHPYFHPRNTNVNLAQISSPNRVHVRTFERGVEQETLACGTGAVAVALTSAQIHGWMGPVAIHTRSEDILEIGFCQKDGLFSEVTMTGPAFKTFCGTFTPT